MSDVAVAGVTLRAADAPRILANIARVLAAMTALGMGKHGYFDEERNIHYCDCKSCVVARRAVGR